MSKIKRVGVLTSGGDAPGMNAAIRSVTRAGINNDLEVFGIRRGYEGMIDGDIFRMDSETVSGIIQKGGTFLLTARSRRFREKEGREEAYRQLRQFDIDAVVVIGGDGSFTGASVMSMEYDIPFIGLPGTIDNDLYGTDYTIGYDTALNTVVEAVDKIRDTASSHNRIFFVEVMGNEAGFLAINSGIACGAEIIMIPEEKNQIDKARNFLAERARKNKSSIILVAENLAEGSAMQIADILKPEFPHFDIRVSILGHIQRGGSPSAKDRIIASRMGAAAIEALIDNQKSVMIGVVNDVIVQVPLNKTIKLHKGIDEALISLTEGISTFGPPKENKKYDLP
ncbi:MAG: 6-phosphofructokinase [Bacteroidales bacterium]|jgi:6-phosphofructokinase 1|nr:6-phosphofructokinase [Bacteroidales bacterium]